MSMNPSFDPVYDKWEDNRSETAYIHESAYVDSPCRIGQNTKILHFSHVMANSIIGNHCHIGHNVTISSGVLIGNHVKVMNNATLNSGVILQDDVYCGPSTIFTDITHIRGKSQSISQIRPTLIKQGAHIGANTTLASGLSIGLYTFIEAGSVIDRNIPDFAIVCGNPLKIDGWRCACGTELSFKQQKALCPQCGKTYVKDSERKIISLREGSADHDSDSEFDPPVRSTQG
jgi:UDP-2-acetamido-3-amino-2,3-dideoxy-glucuronate N-acetyltransferase